MTWRRAFGQVIPSGRSLPDGVWEGRHRALSLLVAAHVAGLFLFGALRGATVLHAGAEVTTIAVCCAAARHRDLSRTARTVAVTFGLLLSSATLVHMADGAIEAHFHFFVVVPLVTLYQSWWPFGVAVSFVAVHHGVVGVVAPERVYNHPEAAAQPVLWAAVHAGFVLASSLASVYAWRTNEDSAARSIRLASEMQDLERRRANAFEINDDVVQGLVLAKLALDLGRVEEAGSTLSRTIAAAQGLVGHMLDDPNAVHMTRRNRAGGV